MQQRGRIYYQPDKPGEQIIAVTGWLSEHGEYELEIVELDAKPHSRCNAAQKIDLSQGHALIEDNTAGATNEYGYGVRCSSDSAFDALFGPQLYYALELEADARYRITGRAYGQEIYLFPSDACSDPAEISKHCRGEGQGLLVESWVAEIFAPPVTGEYILAVDSRWNWFFGDLSIQIERLE